MGRERRELHAFAATEGSMVAMAEAVSMLIDSRRRRRWIGGREALTSSVYAVKPGETELVVETTAAKKVNVSLSPLEAISKDRLTS